MNHYVCRTARGLLCTVAAGDPRGAWRIARKRYRVAVLFSLDGDAWVETADDAYACREHQAGMSADEARELYLEACAAELSPAAMAVLRDLVDGRAPTASCPGRVLFGGVKHAIRALVARGLYDTAHYRLTDIGAAFVASRLAAGGAS